MQNSIAILLLMHVLLIGFGTLGKRMA